MSFRRWFGGKDSGNDLQKNDFRNWLEERRRMVEEQLRKRDISDESVLGAMLKVPRHLFIPEEFRGSAYEDSPVTIGEGQTISQPYMVALMTQCLRVKKGDKILEIGTGSGYQTAVLMELGAKVYTIERIPSLAERAEKRLKEMGYENFKIRIGNGTLGWPEEAPFDRIIVTAGAPEVPTAYKEQLSPKGGILVIPIGSRYSQVLYCITRNQDEYTTEESTCCVFVPLIGKWGWKEDV